ncbi:MAG TPA: hypothetical protein VHZ51_08410 [Ktedonobacteraceae bacterium]|nr:hypothetical protein [Ktedonobacteraceae bacterium]
MEKNISGSEDNNNNQSTDQGSARRSFLRKSVVGAAGEGYQLPLGTVKARMRLGTPSPEIHPRRNGRG